MIVTLPFIEHKLKEFGETHDIAMRRFYSLEEHLNRDSNLKSQYVAFMREFLSLGHMKLVDEIDDNKDLSICFLPHYYVLKSLNETIKLRVVFDSCKSSSAIIKRHSHGWSDGTAKYILHHYKISDLLICFFSRSNKNVLSDID